MRCDFTINDHMQSKDKNYMKILRMYMKAIKRYIAEGPVVAASEAAGDTAVAENSQTAVAVGSETAVAVCSDDPNRRHIPKRQRLATAIISLGVIQASRTVITQR